MNLSEFKPTYNKVIDHCANLIAAGRNCGMPIKALHLKPSQYEWFREGVQVLMKRQVDKDEPLQLDGVNIERASKFQTKDIVIEYYEIAAQS